MDLFEPLVNENTSLSSMNLVLSTNDDYFHYR